jgi:Zn-dependent M28 family amino/carboxypeptidase
MDVYGYGKSEDSITLTGPTGGADFPSPMTVAQLVSNFPSVFFMLQDADGHDVVSHLGTAAKTYNKQGGGTLSSVIGSRPPHR